MLHTVDIIRKKRDGGELTDEEIRFFVEGYTTGDIPDYQAAALMMAIYYRGMSRRETVTLTDAMAHSGDTVDLSRYGTLSADKHSTGGVGDKTSLIVAPIVAALDGKMTKMSGRGLGHTGGTVDKLESIPGYRTSLSTEEFLRQIDEVGLAVIGQTGNLTPADKKLYALRDVTATVDSIPLITASIMSKKLAAGSHNIVLDVKVGSGAFMKTPEQAEQLARAMVDIGKDCGRNMAALITSMDAPLGCAIGNALEVQESVAVLKGESRGALREVCEALATQIVSLTFGWSPEEAARRVQETLDSGAALDKMRAWIAAQGGDVAYIDDPSRFPAAPYVHEVLAPCDGYIAQMDAEQIGHAAVLLGAGRLTKEDAIDHRAGSVLHKTRSDRVCKGEALCTLYSGNETSFGQATALIERAITYQTDKPTDIPLIYSIVR